MRTALLILAFTFLALPARAADATCTTDADCAQGEVCLMTPCAVPPCMPDTDCSKPVDCPTTGTCAQAPWDGSCAADADCPSGFTCDEVEVPCATRVDCAPCTCACPSEGDCQPCECPACPDPEPCTPTTTKACQYHPAACTADVDCKDGWACKADEICSGTGCACPACTSDMECPPCDCGEPTEPVCTSTGSWCQPKETPCTGDADCAAGFECIERSVGVPCACPMCACPVETPDCGCGTCECPAPTIEKVCLPTGWARAGYETSSPTPDAGVPTTDGSDTGATYNQNADATTPPATPGAANESTGKSATASTTDGCNAGPVPGAPVGLVLVLLGGLVPALRRRFGRGS